MWVFSPVLSTGGVNPRHACQRRRRNVKKGERERNVESEREMGRVRSGVRVETGDGLLCRRRRFSKGSRWEEAVVS